MSARARTIGWITSIIGVLIAISLLYFCDPERVPIYPVCTFHLMTGLQCPGCGSLRAMHQLLHGHAEAALRFNALFVLSLPLGAAVGLRYLHRRAQGKPGFGVRPLWFWLFLATWIGFSIVRNLPLFSHQARNVPARSLSITQRERGMWTEIRNPSPEIRNKFEHRCPK